MAARRAANALGAFNRVKREAEYSTEWLHEAQKSQEDNRYWSPHIARNRAQTIMDLLDKHLSPELVRALRKGNKSNYKDLRVLLARMLEQFLEFYGVVEPWSSILRRLRTGLSDREVVASMRDFLREYPQEGLATLYCAIADKCPRALFGG